MKTRLALVLIILLALVSLGVWVGWNSSRYPETILADGTRVQFLGYTHRELHTNYVGSPWKERIRSKLPASLKPMLGAGFLPASSPASQDYYVVWLRLTRPSGAPGIFGNPLVGSRRGIEVVDSHGCVFAGKEYHYSGSVSDGQQWLMYRVMPVFPRRERDITLRLFDRAGDASDMRIPNPEFRKYPEWKPERTMQSSNEITVEFFGWRSAGVPQISVQYGNSPRAAAVPRNMRLADATGNSNAATLCRFETAIRLQDEMIVRPLKPADMLQLRSLHLPKANHIEYKHQKLRAGTNEIGFVAMAGKGRYELKFEGYLDRGMTASPVLFLEFPRGTGPQDFAVWVNNRRTAVTRATVTAAGRPIFRYPLDVHTDTVNVEVGLEPCMPVDLLVPALPSGASL